MAPPEFKGLQIAQCIYKFFITEAGDMIIIAKFRNRKELSDFVKKDLALPYIERTNSHIVLVTVKEDFRLM